MTPQTKPALSLGEFVPLMAFMISLIALAIDAMLPALPAIGQDLHVEVENDQQLVISALFLGMGVAQLFFGPLSDSIGRKWAIYWGLVVFMAGCLMSTLATSFDVMLAGRLLQGLGAAGPRIVCIALIRDQYEGREMAHIMSFVMGVFILVPAVAPALGQGVLMIFNWRAIFVTFLIISTIVWAWFAVRQPETLPPSRRARFSASVIWSGIVETCRNRIAFGYTIVMGMIFGAFVGYLASAQQMFSVIYGVVEMFPLYFGILALAIGFASIVNGKLVLKFGMRHLSIYALVGQTVISFAFLAYIYSMGGVAGFWLNMAFFIVVFFFFGMLFGNLNAMAMEPLGRIAGVGAAVIGSISTLISVTLGTLIGRLFDGTLVPLVAGFAVLGLIAYILMQWTERERP